jgi:propane monooxygenase reductase subunit
VSSLVLRVASIRAATHTSRIVRLSLNGTPFPYQAGQAALVGPADRPDRVPFSLASAPEETAERGWLELLMKVDAAGRWGAHFEPLVRGQRLEVGGPRGSFVFPEHGDERRLLFIAGGTGIAPLRAMIRHAQLSAWPGRMSLLYSARTPRDFAYLRELRGMARRGEINLALTATRECTPRWPGERGRIAVEQLGQLVEDAATRCFVCGPVAMVADVRPMLRAFGIESSRIHVEDW